MPSENLTVAKVLNILAWVILCVGFAAIIMVFFFIPMTFWARAAFLIFSICTVLTTFSIMSVLARILKTVTWHYQLSWEQFEELADDIDELDGKNDGDDGPQCAYCGALLEGAADVCPRCGKKIS